MYAPFAALDYSRDVISVQDDDNDQVRKNKIVDENGESMHLPPTPNQPTNTMLGRLVLTKMEAKERLIGTS